jgi:hypothetical protein
MNPDNSLSETLFPHIRDIHLTVSKQDYGVNRARKTYQGGRWGREGTTELPLPGTVYSSVGKKKEDSFDRWYARDIKHDGETAS